MKRAILAIDNNYNSIYTEESLTFITGRTKVLRYIALLNILDGKKCLYFHCDKEPFKIDHPNFISDVYYNINDVDIIREYNPNETIIFFEEAYVKPSFNIKTQLRKLNEKGYIIFILQTHHDIKLFANVYVYREYKDKILLIGEKIEIKTLNEVFGLDTSELNRDYFSSSAKYYLTSKHNLTSIEKLILDYYEAKDNEAKNK